MRLPTDVLGRTTSRAAFYSTTPERFAAWLREGLGAPTGPLPGDVWRQSQLERGDELRTLVSQHLQPVPLETGHTRYLMLGQDGWTTVLDNGALGTDPGVVPQRAARSLKVTAVNASASTVADPFLPGTTLSVHEPSETDESGSVLRRSIYAADQGNRWLFDTTGEPFAFEDTTAYRRRRIRDRFTPQMLDDYLCELGVPAFALDGVYDHVWLTRAEPDDPAKDGGSGSMMLRALSVDDPDDAIDHEILMVFDRPLAGDLDRYRKLFKRLAPKRARWRRGPTILGPGGRSSMIQTFHVSGDTSGWLGHKLDLANQLCIQIGDTEIDGRPNVEWLEWAFPQLCAEMAPAWAAAFCTSEYLTKVADPAHGGEVVAIDWGRHAPGIFWMNYLGRAYRDLLGAERLASIPGRHVEPVGTGVLFTTIDLPSRWRDREAARVEQGVRDHLGTELFFSRDHPDRPGRVPSWPPPPPPRP